MLKIRGNNTQIAKYWGYYWTNPNNIYRADYLVQGSVERIADEQPRFERFGDCLHSEVKVKIEEHSVSGVGYTSSSVYAWKYFFLPSVDVDSGFNSRAFQAMKPEIKSVIQAPVELREFVTGWKALLKPFELKSNLASKAGNVNLWWQFGVAPTVGAVQDVIKGLESFEKRLKDFQKNQGKPLTSHYREIEEVPSENRQTAVQPAVTSWATYQTVNKHEIHRVATMSYKYSILGIDGMSSDEIWLRAMGDLLGVSRILAMAWESTPWSFIVDWFFSVGDFLEQFDTPFLDTAVEVIDYCISEKMYCTGECFMTRGGGTQVSAGTYSYSYYKRTRCLPDYSYFGIRESGNFGPRQFLLGLSLLVS